MRHACRKLTLCRQFLGVYQLLLGKLQFLQGFFHGDRALLDALLQQLVCLLQISAFALYAPGHQLNMVYQPIYISIDRWRQSYFVITVRYPFRACRIGLNARLTLARMTKRVATILESSMARTAPAMMSRMFFFVSLVTASLISIYRYQGPFRYGLLFPVSREWQN